MDKLFSNHTTPQKNIKDKNEDSTDDFIISEELLGSKEKTSSKSESIAISENSKKIINDPLNLFSNDIEESSSNNIIKSRKKELKCSKKKIHYPSSINDEFTIDENLLGIKKKPDTDYNESIIDDDLFGNASLNSQKLNNNVNSPVITSEIENPLSNLFSNNMNNSSNHISNSSKKGKEKISNKNSKNKDKSYYVIDEEKEENIDNKRTYLKNDEDDDDDDDDDNDNNNNNNNNNKLMSDPNDEIEDLLNLFSNDIKDSSVIDSDEEFIMSSNNGNSNKVNVKSLYTNDFIQNNENELILDNNMNNINSNSDNIYKLNNNGSVITSNIEKRNEDEIILDNTINDSNDEDEDEDEDVFKFNDNKDKIEAENKLIQLFDNDEIDNETNYESDDDIFDEQKKYYKQASLKELMNNKKSKDENDLINFSTPKYERKNKLMQDSQTNDNNLLNSNIFSCSNKEKKSYSLSHSRPKKTKLDFYFKELPSSSASSSTFSKSLKVNESASSSTPTNSSKSSKINEINNNSNVKKESSFFYNNSKNRKRTNEEDNIVKNPFIISKKQKLENKILSDKYNEHNQLNNVLLKFESNDKPKTPQTSIFDQLSSKKKQKKQVSLLSLFSSQSDNKNKKVLSPVKPEVYNSIITDITKPKKVNHQDFHKARSSNSNVRIRNRQNKLSMEKINYIKPSVYILTCEKKEIPNYHNPNINKRGINHPKPVNIFDCEEIKHSFRPSNKRNNYDRNANISDNYDLMKEHLIKKRERSLVNSFITSFEDSSHKNKNRSAWPPIGWNNYFQNSISNSF